jgi:hypothetical protein
MIDLKDRALPIESMSTTLIFPPTCAKLRMLKELPIRQLSATLIFKPTRA